MDVEKEVLDFIAVANEAETFPNSALIAEVLELDLDQVGRVLRRLIDQGHVIAERVLEGDDGYWASGLSLS